MKTRIVYPQMWLDDKFAGCSVEAKLLFCYLINNLSLGLTRYLHVNNRLLTFDTGLSAEQLDKAKKEIEAIRWCFFYKDWVYHNHKAAYVDFQGRDRVLKAKAEELKAIPNEVRDYFNRLITGYQPNLNPKSKTLNPKSKDSEPVTNGLKEDEKLTDEDLKVFDNPIDKAAADCFEKAKGLKLCAVSLLFALSCLFLPYSVSAHTVSVQYSIKTSTSSNLSFPTPTPSARKVATGAVPVKPFLPVTEVEKLICKYFGQDCRTAVAIARAESGLRCSAIGDGHLTPHSYGVFQIRGLTGRPPPEQLLDCETNVKWAHQMYLVQGWSPWSVFTNKSYLKFL